MFSLVRAVILKPLSYREPERLVHIYENYLKGSRFKWGQGASYIIVRPGTLHEWRVQSTSFESIEAARWRTKTLTGGDRTESVWGNEVTEGYFRIAGVPPGCGRPLVRDDVGAGAPRAVVLSDRLWRRRYAGDPNIIGQHIQIDGSSVPVVGVMPPGFAPTRGQPPDVWVPYSPRPGEQDDRVTWSFITLARLKPGVTFEDAHREMDAISDRLTAAYPQDYHDMCAVLVPVMGEVVGSYGTLLYTLLGAVGLVLLVGCVNVANLMLARATERSQEFSIRSALGAPRSRLIRHVLTEGLLLSVAGGLLGLVVASLSLPAALALLPANNSIPRMNEVSLDRTVLGFTFAVAVAAGLLFALPPALRASHGALSESLKETGRGTTLERGAKRLGDALVITEVALSLLVGAGLLLRSFVRLQAVDSGFDTQHVLAMRVTVPTHRYGMYEVGGTNPPRASRCGGGGGHRIIAAETRTESLRDQHRRSWSGS